MSTAYICDFCGGRYDKPFPHGPYVRLANQSMVYIDMPKTYTTTNGKRDACPKCMAEILRQTAARLLEKRP